MMSALWHWTPPIPVPFPFLPQVSLVGLAGWYKLCLRSGNGGYSDALSTAIRVVDFRPTPSVVDAAQGTVALTLRGLSGQVSSLVAVLPEGHDCATHASASATRVDDVTDQALVTAGALKPGPYQV